MILGFPFARLAERYNRVRIIATVFAFWSLMTALCGAATSFIMLAGRERALEHVAAGQVLLEWSAVWTGFPPSAFGSYRCISISHRRIQGGAYVTDFN